MCHEIGCTRLPNPNLLAPGRRRRRKKRSGRLEVGSAWGRGTKDDEGFKGRATARRLASRVVAACAAMVVGGRCGVLPQDTTFGVHHQKHVELCNRVCR
jgi:hypothetical protein